MGRHGGRIIDTAGDGILAEFPSVIGATECAVQIQTVMAARNEDEPEHRRMLLRIGINLGDVIHDDTWIYGDGINVAARLEGLAEPAGVLVSRAVHDQVRDRLDLAFEDLGERELKNIARPVPVYRLRPRASRRQYPSGAPPCRYPTSHPSPSSPFSVPWFLALGDLPGGAEHVGGWHLMSRNPAALLAEAAVRLSIGAS